MCSEWAVEEAWAAAAAAAKRLIHAASLELMPHHLWIHDPPDLWIHDPPDPWIHPLGDVISIDLLTDTVDANSEMLAMCVCVTVWIELGWYTSQSPSLQV